MCILCLNARANLDFVLHVGDLPPQGYFVYSNQFSAFFKIIWQKGCVGPPLFCLK